MFIIISFSCCTLLGEPNIVILDESTNDLDIQSVIILKNTLLELKRKGNIVLISSHVLDFISKICDKAIFMKDGTIIKNVNNNGIDLDDVYMDIYIQ